VVKDISSLVHQGHALLRSSLWWFGVLKTWFLCR